jgi:hypothetical protein
MQDRLEDRVDGEVVIGARNDALVRSGSCRGTTQIFDELPQPLNVLLGDVPFVEAHRGAPANEPRRGRDGPGPGVGPCPHTRVKGTFAGNLRPDFTAVVASRP